MIRFNSPWQMLILFLASFCPQPCSLIKHPQITISGILRLSMFFSSCGDIVHFLPYLDLHVSNWVMFWLTPSGQEGNWRQSLRMGYMLTCMSEASPPTSRKVGLLALNTEWAISPALRVQGNLEVQSLWVPLIKMFPSHVSRSSSFLTRALALA